MNLDTLLQELSNDNAAFEKSASEAKESGTESQARALRESLRAVSEKLASANNYAPATDDEPLSDLVKMAADLGNADHIGLLKEANIYGAGVADGFVGRLNEYNSVDFTKVASENDVPDHLVEKIATEAIEGFLYAQQVKTAEAQNAYAQQAPAQQAPALPPELDGYVKTAAYLQKTAGDAYAMGRYQSALALGLEKSASKILRNLADTTGLIGRGARGQFSGDAFQTAAEAALTRPEYLTGAGILGAGALGAGGTLYGGYRGGKDLVDRLSPEPEPTRIEAIRARLGL